MSSMNQGSVYPGSGGGGSDTTTSPPAAPLSLFPRVTTTGTGNPAVSIHEALMSRIRPFGLAAGDLADLQNSAGLSNLVRPEGFPSLPLLSHMQNGGFLPHSLASSGAFRPMFSSLQAADQTSLLKSFPSAFQPPVSREKVSPSSLFSPGQNLFPHLSPSSSRSSPSPLAKASPSPLAKGDENSNTEASLCLTSGDTRLLEDAEEGQNKRLRVSAGLLCCPICGSGVSASEIESHYLQELDFLSKLTLGLVKDVQTSKLSRYSYSQGLEQAPRTRWESYQRIQRNRQSRIKVKLSRKAGKRSDEELEEDQQRAGAMTPGEVGVQTEDDVDIVGEDTEERSANNTTTSVVKEEKLQGLYGPPQFTEEDIITFLNQHSQTKARRDSSPKCNGNGEDREGEGEEEVGDREGVEVERDMEGGGDKIPRKKQCCLCKENIHDAIVSIECWHVNCKLCWFKQLMKEGKCTRCETECEPRHLRKVYL